MGQADIFRLVCAAVLIACVVGAAALFSWAAYRDGKEDDQ